MPNSARVRLRAFGSFEIRVADAAVFSSEIVGTMPTLQKKDHRTAPEYSGDPLCRTLWVESQIPARPGANYNELGRFVRSVSPKKYVK
jgi:hypothetical protein